jgi:hypothetical protein
LEKVSIPGKKRYSRKGKKGLIFQERIVFQERLDISGNVRYYRYSRKG